MGRETQKGAHSKTWSGEIAYHYSRVRYLSNSLVQNYICYQLRFSILEGIKTTKRNPTTFEMQADTKKIMKGKPDTYRAQAAKEAAIDVVNGLGNGPPGRMQ